MNGEGTCVKSYRQACACTPVRVVVWIRGNAETLEDGTVYCTQQMRIRCALCDTMWQMGDTVAAQEADA